MTDENDIPFREIKYPDDYVVLQDDRPKCVESVGIDFDEAKKAWRINKAKPKKKYWRYGCTKIKSDGKLCRRPLAHNQSKFCKYHFNQASFAGIETS